MAALMGAGETAAAGFEVARTIVRSPAEPAALRTEVIYILDTILGDVRADEGFPDLRASIRGLLEGVARDDPNEWVRAQAAASLE